MTADATEALQRLLSTQAFETRLLARRGESYVLLVRRAAGGAVRLELGTEAAGARFEVDADMRARLGAGGFARIAGDTTPRPWAAVHRGYSAEQLRDRLQDAFEALGAPDVGVRFELMIDAEAPPDNPRLVEAMRAVARSGDVPTRQALYAALVNATLLIPVDPGSLDAPPEQQQPLVLDEVGGRPVYAAFSDAGSLRSWRHAGHPWAGVDGAEFFAHAERAGVGAVRINPGGKVGGELYPNEVEAITEGVRRFHAQRMN